MLKGFLVKAESLFFGEYGRERVKMRCQKLIAVFWDQSAAQEL